MDRRDLLKWLSAAGAAYATPALAQKWIVNPHVSKLGANIPARPKADAKRFHNTFAAFRGVSKAIDKNVFLYQNLQKQIGEIVPHDQSTIIDKNGKVVLLGEGDCVGQATAMGCDILAATNIHMLGIREKWLAKASVEMAYAGSRIEIGRDDNPGNPDKVNWVKGRGGSHGEWAARFVKEYGVLHRIKYSNNTNKIDLQGYSPDRSRKYRDAGVPDWLESFARNHPVKEITNVQTGQEALDAVCAGQPVIMCSSYAFGKERDKEGFATPFLGGGGGRGWFQNVRVQWWHAMVLTGAILEGKRKGGIIQNSHGAWNHGPQPYDMPDGAFGVEDWVLDLMVKDWFDCYALSSYTGHSARRMRHRLY